MDLAHQIVRHTITPMIFIEVAGEPVYAPDPDADIQVAEGCNICNAEIGWCIEHTGCPGVPTDGS